jgi:hypothetical protein
MTVAASSPSRRRFPRALIALAVVAYCALSWAAFFKVVDVGVQVAMKSSDSRMAERADSHSND